MTDEAGIGAVSPERQFAEDVGRVFETFGVPRMAGRVLGWLLICDPPRQSTADLIWGLGVSKGAMSAAVQTLIAGGLVERVAVPGQRGDHFELRPDTFQRAHDRLGTMREFRELMDRGLSGLGPDPGARGERLRQTRDFYAFLEREYPRLTAKFEAERSPQDSPAPA